MPDPVLALASFVGLLTYAVVGGVVGTATIRFWDRMGWGYSSGDYLKGIAGTPGGDDDAWLGFGFAAALWPAILAVTAVAGSVFAVGFGPFWITRRVGRYAAIALIERKANAT